MSFHVLVGHLKRLLRKLLIQILSPFLTGSFIFLLLSGKNFLHILDIVRYMTWKYFLHFCGCLTWFEALIFKILVNSSLSIFGVTFAIADLHKTGLIQYHKCFLLFFLRRIFHIYLLHLGPWSILSSLLCIVWSMSPNLLFCM